MSNIPAEIIKQYRVRVEGLDFTVYGRIIKSVSGNEDVFLGELSHYCRQSEDAFSVNKPNLVSGNIGNVEQGIISYLERFATIDVEVNLYY